jgi:hypothetical protein
LAKLADAGEFKTPEPAPTPVATPTDQAAPPTAGGTE